MGALKNKQKFLDVQRSEMGKADTLRYNVNYFLLEEKYDQAIEEIEKYKNNEHFDIPQYKEKITPYLNHAIDLIYAIRAKKGLFENIFLTRSKQQEIQITVKNHYNDLQEVFKKIEQIRTYLIMDDTRSTIWVAKSLVFSISFLVVFFLVKEFFYDIAPLFDLFLEESIQNFIDWLSSFFF